MSVSREEIGGRALVFGRQIGQCGQGRAEGGTMPHVIVKMYSGRSEQQKKQIAEEVAKAVMASAGSAERSVSVSIEDVEPEDWAEAVYRPDILQKPDQLYKKPGYDPL